MDLRSEVELNIESILIKIEKAENYYKSLEPLEFIKYVTDEQVKLKKNNTIESYCRKFFDKFNSEYVTVIKKSTNTQTGINCRRSAGDVFRTGYSYLGDKITLAGVLTQIYELLETNKIGSNYCFDINKRVYIDRGMNNGCYYDKNQPDELGLTQNHYLLLKKYIQEK